MGSLKGGDSTMSPISTLFSDVLSDFPTAVAESLTNHPMGQLLRHTLPTEIGQQVEDSYYRVKGSPGQGGWAETPWVAIFDPLVTESAQKGHYLVYLFRGDGTGVYLSLNQGTTEVYDQYHSDYIRVLEMRARAFARHLPQDLIEGLQQGPIALVGDGTLTRGYVAGSIVARFYPAEELPNDNELVDDLRQLLHLYRLTVETRDEWQEGDTEPLIDVKPGLERARYRWHRRAERNRGLANKAKAVHGYTCNVCSFNFERRYGDIGSSYIEAHHLTPMRELEGRPTKLDPKTDFTVVCSNCHRMLHRADPPLTIEELNHRIAGQPAPKASVPRQQLSESA